MVSILIFQSFNYNFRGYARPRSPPTPFVFFKKVKKKMSARPSLSNRYDPFVVGPFREGKALGFFSPRFRPNPPPVAAEAQPPNQKTKTPPLPLPKPQNKKGNHLQLG